MKLGLLRAEVCEMIGAQRGERFNKLRVRGEYIDFYYESDRPDPRQLSLGPILDPMAEHITKQIIGEMMNGATGDPIVPGDDTEKWI